MPATVATRRAKIQPLEEVEPQRERLPFSPLGVNPTPEADTLIESTLYFCGPVVPAMSLFERAHDRGPKAELYAEAGIPEYWIVDLSARQLEIRRKPTKTASGFAYARTIVLGSADEAVCDSVPGVVIAVADLLP